MASGLPSPVDVNPPFRIMVYADPLFMYTVAW